MFIEYIKSPRLILSNAFLMLTILFTDGLPAFASSNQSLVYHGRIVRPDGTAINSGNLTFTLSLYSPSPSTCLLYQETQTVSMLGKQGLFNLTLGEGVRTDGGAHSFNQIFVNNATLSGLTCSSGTSFNATGTDDRELIVSFQDGGSPISLSPMKIKSVPFALQAHEIDGWGINNLVKVSSIGSPTTFTTSEMAHVKLLAAPGPCAAGEVIKWNGSAWACAADATGGSPADASYAAKGVVQFLTDAATSGITVSSGVASVNSGTGANQIVKLDGTAKLPAVDGSALTSLTPANLSAAVPINKGGTGQITAVLGFNALSPITAKGDLITSNGTNNVALPVGSNGYVLTADSAQATGLKWAAIPVNGTVTSVSSANADISVATGTTTPVLTLNSGTGANQIVKLDGTGKLPAVDGSALTNISATAYSGVLPIANGGTNSSTALSNNRVMVSSGGKIVEAGAMTNGQIIVGSTGAAPAIATLGSSNGIDITTGAGTLSIATNATDANTANKIVSRDASGNFAAGAITNNSNILKGATSGTLTMTVPTTITSYTLTWPSAVGGAGSFLTTDASGNLSWGSPAAISDSSYSTKGAVQFLTDAATSGITVSSGVANVNTGTGANQIVKLDGSAKLPAVDGSALTNLDPTHLSAAVPINKGGTGQTTKTDSFDALSPNTTKGDLIAYDGTDNVRVPAGTNGYVLQADSTQAAGVKWAAAANGTVTSVTSANADISVATGTTTPVLTLNSGTGANQIVKLTAASKYPAVDGSLITNIDAGNISAGTLPVTRGGTGNTTFGNSGVIVSNVTGTALQSLNCTNGQVITFDVSGYAVCGSAAGATGFVNGGNSFGAAATLGTNDNYALNFETNNTSRMTIDNSGKVGIGTSAPLSMLQVGASATGLALPNAVGTYLTPQILVAPTSGMASISVGVNDGTHNRRVGLFMDETNGIGGISTSYSAIDFPFIFRDAFGERLRIDTGKVGIGNSAPGALLDIGTIGKLGTMRLGGSTSGYVQLQPAAAAGSWTMTLPADAGTNGYVLSTNGSGVTSWVAQSAGGSGTVTAVTSANTDIIVATGTTTPVLTLNTGTGNNQIVKLDGSAKLPAVDGSALTNLNPANLSAAVPISKGGTGQTTAVLGFNALSPITAKGDLITSNGTNNVPLPVGSNGYVLTADSAQTTGLKWAAASNGTVTSVTSANTDINIVTGISTPVLTLNSGTGANQIVKLDGSAKLPAVDGSALTNLNAGNISAGTLPVTRGGTGNTTYGNSGVIVSNITGSALQSLNCTSGQVITFDVSGYATCGSAAGATGFVNGGNSFGGVATLGTNDNFALNFETNNTTQMSILSSGFVGIGNTAPDARLHVGAGSGLSSAPGKPRGASTIYSTLMSPTSGSSISQMIGVSNGTRNTRAEFFVADHATEGAGAWGLWSTFSSAGSQPFVIGVDDTERLRINSSGYVGIGTTNPGSMLDVVGDISTSASVYASAGSAAYPSFTVGSGTTGTGIYYPAAGTLGFSTNTGERMRIDSSGKVGIGNIAPGALLDVGKAGTTLGTLRLEGNTSGYVQIQPAAAAGSWTMTLPANAGTNGYVLSTNGSGVTSWVAQSGGGSGTVTSVTSANADIGVATSTSTPVLTLNSGTGANQIVKLDGSAKLPAVDGSALTNLSAGNISSGTLPVTRGGTGATAFGNNGVIVSNGTGSALQTLNCTSGQVLNFDASGFAVCGTYTGFINGGNTLAAAATLGTNDANSLIFETNNTDRMTILASGNVGIGLTNPSTLLDVNGAITASPFGTAAGQTGQFVMRELAANGVNTFTIRAPDSLTANRTLTLPDSSGSTGAILTSTGSSGATSWSQSINISGNITSTNGDLTIDGDIFSDKEITADDKLISNGSLEVNSTTRSGNGSFTSPAYSFINDTNIGMYRVSADVLGFTTAGAERMKIDASGNVGIGTSTTGAAKLEVFGAIWSKPTAVSNIATTLDLSTSNTFTIPTASGSAFTLTNALDGGQYTVVITDATSRTYTFSCTGATKYHPANAATTASTTTVYSIISVKNGAVYDCYVKWASGYQ